MPVKINRTKKVAAKPAKKKTPSIRDNVIAHAREKIDQLSPNKAVSYLRGMAAIDPDSETSKQLRELMRRVQEGAS